jgi:hypothetical protein
MLDDFQENELDVVEIPPSRRIEIERSATKIERPPFYLSIGDSRFQLSDIEYRENGKILLRIPDIAVCSDSYYVLEEGVGQNVLRKLVKLRDVAFTS